MKCNKFFALLMLLSVVAFSDRKFESYMNRKEYDKAIAYAEKELDFQNDAYLMSSLGYANEQLNYNEKAIAFYMGALRADPSNHDAATYMAQLYNKMGLPEKAYALLKDIVVKDSSGYLLMEYGKACMSLKRYDEAEKALRKVGSVDSKYQLGTVYFGRKMYKQALPFLCAVYKYKESDSLALMIADSYIAINKSDSALVYLKSSTKKNSPTEMKLRLARIYAQSNDLNQASSIYNQIPQPFYALPDYFYIGNCSRMKGDYLKANYMYDKGIKCPEAKTSRLIDSLQVYTAHGYVELKKYQLAIAAYKPYETSSVPWIVYDLARIYDAIGETTKAGIYADKVIKNDPKNVQAYLILIKSCEKQGQLTRAKTLREKIATLESSNNSISGDLGSYYYGSGEYKKALEYYEKAYISNEEPAILEKIADCAYRIGNKDKAQDAAETVLKSKISPLCHEILYDINFSKGRYAKATPYLEALVKEKEGIRYYKDLAVCYDKLNQKDNLVKTDETIVEIDGTDIPSRERLASYKMQKNDYAGSLKLYDELAGIKNLDVKTYFDMIKMSSSLNDDKKTLQYLTQITILDRKSVKAYQMIGDIYYKQKDLKKAYDSYFTAYSIDPTSKGYLKNFSYVIIDRGSSQQLLKVLESAIINGEADPAIMNVVADSYYAGGDHTRALKLYEECLKASPTNIELLSKVATCQASTGKIDGAIISYEQLISMRPESEKEYKTLASLYEKKKSSNAMIDTYKRYLKKFKSEEMAQKVADYEYKKENYTEAVKFYTSINVSKEPYLLYNYSRALYKNGDYDAAIVSLEGMSTKYPLYKDIPEVYNMLASCYDGKKQYQKSVKYGKLCCSWRPMDSTMAYQTAVWQESLHVELARDIYEQNTEKFPGDPRNFKSLSTIYFDKLRNFPKAKTALIRYLELDKNNMSMMVRLARTYAYLNEKDRAEATYRTILSTDSKNFEANKYLGISLYQKGQQREGLIYLEVAKGQDMNDPEILVILSKVYRADKKYADAVMFLQSAKKQRPQDCTIREMIVEIYEEQKEETQALTEMQGLLDVIRSSEYLSRYAHMLDKSERYGDAELIVQEMRRKDPRNLDLLLFLGDIQESKKDYESAIETYKKISYIKSDYAPALSKRARIYLIKKEVELSREYFEKAVKANPSYADAEYGLAMYYKVIGRQDLSDEHLKRANKLGPADPEAMAEMEGKK